MVSVMPANDDSEEEEGADVGTLIGELIRGGLREMEKTQNGIGLDWIVGLEAGDYIA